MAVKWPQPASRNASKEWSGTIKEVNKKHKKIDRAVQRMISQYRDNDASNQVNDHIRREAEEKNIDTLQKASHKIKKFCEVSEELRGLSGKVIKRNITDKESASMMKKCFCYSLVMFPRLQILNPTY